MASSIAATSSVKSARSGTPTIYVSHADGNDVAAFDATAPAVPPTDLRDLDWSPDGTRLAYTREAEDGTTNLVVDDGTNTPGIPAFEVLVEPDADGLLGG